MSKLWTSIPLRPLSGKLNTRSRPADLLPGEWRHKLNFGIDRLGALCRRTGYSTLSFGPSSNWDHHEQTDHREPITFLMESTAPDGTRRLFDGSQTNLSVLDNDTGTWASIATVTGADDARWKGAGLENQVVFTNGVDEPLIHELGSTTTGPISSLQDPLIAVTKAKLVVQFAGVLLLLNVTEKGEPAPNRVRWSDYHKPEDWDTQPQDTVAGFQDLDYGDEILNALELAGALFVFTTRSIWKVTASGASTGSAFNFTRIWSDPINQNGCLAYANAIATNGREAYWLGRDSLWTYNPLLPQPMNTSDHDWLLKASGNLYQGAERVDDACCHAPIAGYWPDTDEVFFFYPRRNRANPDLCLPDYGLVLNLQHRTADHVDYGMSALVGFRPTVAQCGITATLIGASTVDWCLKAIGNVFHREHYTDIVDLAFNLIAGENPIVAGGYESVLRTICPFGLPEQDKRLRSVQVEHNTRPTTPPGNVVMRLRIANSHTLGDPNAELSQCGVLWHDIADLPLQCLGSLPVASMLANNLRPSEETATKWECYEQGRWLYFEIRLLAPNGSAPVSGDTAWSNIVFSVQSKE